MLIIIILYAFIGLQTGIVEYKECYTYQHWTKFERILIPTIWIILNLVIWPAVCYSKLTDNK